MDSVHLGMTSSAWNQPTSPRRSRAVWRTGVRPYRRISLALSSILIHPPRFPHPTPGLQHPRAGIRRLSPELTRTPSCPSRTGSIARGPNHVETTLDARRPADSDRAGHDRLDIDDRYQSCRLEPLGEPLVVAMDRSARRPVSRPAALSYCAPRRHVAARDPNRPPLGRSADPPSLCPVTALS